MNQKHAPNIYRARAENLKIKTLLYGNPGVGKTTFCLTANDHPALAPALVLNFEGGLMSVVGRGDVDVYDVNVIDDLEAIFWNFQESNKAVNQYKTIIVDSGSELYNKALREAVQSNMARARNRKGDEDDFQIEDYGKAGNVTFRLFSMFRDLPRHVIVTAHAKFVYPSGGDALTSQPTEVRPAFSPSITTRLEGIFDNVHFMYTFDDNQQINEEESVVVTRRGMLTRTMGAYHAKTRGPNFASALGDTVIDPTLPSLYNLLLETEGGQSGEGRMEMVLAPLNPNVIADLNSMENEQEGEEEPIEQLQEAVV